MCGIAGVLSLDGRPIPQGMVERMTRSLAHRGPDGEGFYADDTMALGHRRLSIIDLDERSAQPMSYRDRFTISYNGEIYNYIELREELRQLGHQFRTESDTEVLLAAFSEWGHDCLLRLDGMFALAIWDKVEKTLFCARDPFGEKPFFFCEVPGLFLFASEMKAIAAAGVELSLRSRFLHGFLRHSVVQLPDFPDETFYAPARILLAAHYLECRAGQTVNPKRYWKLEIGTSSLGMPEAAERLHELLSLSVKRRLRSDVVVGSSLSGGMDSSSIVALTKRAGAARQHTFSARFDDSALDEGGYMETVRTAFGVAGHEVWPDGAGLGEEFTKLFYHQEEPFTTPSPYAQWAVMRLAQQNGVTVLLDGQGADETLAGYTHFFEPLLRGLARRHPLRALKEFRAIRRLYAVNGPTLGWLRHAMLGELPSALMQVNLAVRDPAPGWLNPDFESAHQREPRPFRSFKSLSESLRFFTVEHGLRTLLRYADRSSMAFGREIRLPFLDRELVSWIFTLPDEAKLSDGISKRVLRNAMKGEVPDIILNRHDKKGFDVPVAKWLEAPRMRERAAAALVRLRKERVLKGTPPTSPDSVWRLISAAAVFEFLDTVRTPNQTQ